MSQIGPGIQVKGAIPKGGSQPPRKRIEVIALIRIMFAYSPRKNSAKLIELYSTKNPATISLSRAQLLEASHSTPAVDLTFPIIVRPRGSHAGAGLARIDDTARLERYLAECAEEEFFISRFIDYSSSDSLFRKYRIVLVDGQPYACHLAIADRWDIWYLNAGMSASASKRAEEEAFMRTFDSGFAARHRAALSGLANRIGLDYFTIDCAETKQGSLLIFEADNTAIVHDMDPPDIFPYKVPQMQKVFAAFAAMLHLRAGRPIEAAA